MISLDSFRGDSFLVVGFGRSGCSAAMALRAGGACVSVWDDNPDKRSKAESLGLSIISIETADLHSIDNIIWSPGVPHTQPQPHHLADKAKDAGHILRCDIDLLATAQPSAKFIGITGTNGKSTTTALTGHVLKAAGRNISIGGNLGMPVLDLDPLGAEGIYVLELSSYQTELTPHLSCSTATLLNIASDHLDRHGGLEGYIAAKTLLFKNQGRGATAIVGLDDPISRDIFSALKKRQDITVIGISRSPETDARVSVREGILVDKLDNDCIEITNLNDIASLPGEHNWQNAASSYAIARTHGVSPSDIVSAFKTFPGLPHRQEIVGTVTGVTFVNDSKATNADAAANALACYSYIYWIAGGQEKEGGISSLSSVLTRIRHAFLIGDAATSFSLVLQAAGVAVSRHESLEDAVKQAGKQAFEDAVSPATVLLSPACASFDMFENFEKRGEVFRNTVHTLWPTTTNGVDGGHV